MKAMLIASIIGSYTMMVSCNSTNNLLLGEVRGKAGTHDITVTDCYRSSFDAPRQTATGFEFSPCRDARVEIRREELVVNGTSYGELHKSDTVTVDHGTVLINGKRALIASATR